MVRINKHELSQKELEGLFKQFSNFLSDQTKNTGLSLQELLGPEERIMLAKRLAIMVMINEGYSAYRIADTLHISQTTVANIKDRLEDGAYDHILNRLTKNKESYKGILKLVESILSVGGIMPSRGGLDRYRGLRG